MKHFVRLPSVILCLYGIADWTRASRVFHISLPHLCSHRLRGGTTAPYNRNNNNSTTMSHGFTRCRGETSMMFARMHRETLIIMCEHTRRRGCDCSVELCHRSTAMHQCAKPPHPDWLDRWFAACCWAEHVKAICSGWQVFFAADKLLRGSDGTQMRPTSSREGWTLFLACMCDDCFIRMCWKSIMQKGETHPWFEDYILEQPRRASLFQR